MADVSRYRTAKAASQYDSGSDIEEVIPAGVPYLTKVNGKLVMARDKKARPKGIAVDLLGEAFRGGTRIMRRYNSVEKVLPAPFFIDGVQYVPQPQLAYSTPITQQPFSQAVYQAPPFMNQLLSQQQLSWQVSPLHQGAQIPQPPPPTKYTSRNEPSPPTKQDLEFLKRLDDHFDKTKPASASQKPANKEDATTKATTTTIAQHKCAGCSRIRSRKYHREHSIRDGETPVPTFCRGCQREASLTSSSEDSKQPMKLSRKTAKKENIKQKKSTKETRDDRRLDRQSRKLKQPPIQQASGSRRRFWTNDSVDIVPESFEDKFPPPMEQASGSRRRFWADENVDIVPEIFENEFPAPRGRPRQRADLDDSILGRAPLSPRQYQRAVSRSPSNSRLERYEIPVKNSQPRRHFQPRQATPLYRYVEVRRETTPVPHERPNEPRYAYYNSSYDEDFSAFSARPIPRDDYIVEERSEPSVNSDISSQHQHRMRDTGKAVEVISPTQPQICARTRNASKAAPEDSPTQRQIRNRTRNTGKAIQQTSPTKRQVHPHPRGEETAVTEDYNSRPRRLSNVSEMQLSTRAPNNTSSINYRPRATQEESEVASRYYQEDWSQVEPIAPQPKIERRRVARRGYRRDEYQVSELERESSDSREYIREAELRAERVVREPEPRSSSTVSPGKRGVRGKQVKFHRAEGSSRESAGGWAETTRSAAGSVVEAEGWGRGGHEHEREREREDEGW